MKAWKMVGCLVLLCVMICGCVVIGQNTAVSAEEQLENGGAGGEGLDWMTNPTPPAGSSGGTAGGNSTTVDKTYSEGLYFRSNGDGTCSLAGMGSCTATCVLIPPQSPAGDKVVEILPYALADSIVGAVEIPTTVKTLSAVSFARCSRLAYVRVAAGNEWFEESDGALYTRGGKTLVYCPAARNSRELALHPEVTRIAAGALRECPMLDTVLFCGTTAEWHSIIVGDENDALYAASFKFTS